MCLIDLDYFHWLAWMDWFVIESTWYWLAWIGFDWVGLICYWFDWFRASLDGFVLPWSVCQQFRCICLQFSHSIHIVWTHLEEQVPLGSADVHLLLIDFDRCLIHLWLMLIAFGRGWLVFNWCWLSWIDFSLNLIGIYWFVIDVNVDCVWLSLIVFWLTFSALDSFGLIWIDLLLILFGWVDYW